MNAYYSRIKINGEKLNRIFKRLDDAKYEIENCMRELDDLGVIEITPGDNSEELAESSPDLETEFKKFKEIMKNYLNQESRKEVFE